MNKYQKALFNIENISGVDFRATSTGTVLVIEQEFYDNIDILRELVHKEKPMKPTKQYKREYKLGNSGTCGNCNKSIYYQQLYCPYCRQKTDWSVEE